MLNKIDPYLKNLVSTYGVSKKDISCLVYTNNVNFLKRYFFNNKLGEVVATYPFINAVGIKINNNNIYKVAKLNIVTYITAISKVSCLINHSKKTMNLKQNLISSNEFTCAIIDTGVAPTLDLVVPKNKIIYFKDFVNNKTVPYDDNGHGTMVASAISGNGLVSGGKYSGVVYNQNLIALKALDKNGETDAYTILDAMEWIFKNYKKYKIKVVCMSFGSSPLGENDPLILGAEALWNLGIVVVVAAGNSGPFDGSIKSPGASSKIITVGAMNDRKIGSEFEIANFSSRGPILNNYKPDLVAPGVDIISGSNFKISKTHYSKMSGTSISTPMVAGIVCYMITLNPNLKPNEIKKILISNCSKITGNRNYEGFGYFDGKCLN